jgi:hypothetical protein
VKAAFFIMFIFSIGYGAIRKRIRQGGSAPGRFLPRHSRALPDRAPGLCQASRAGCRIRGRTILGIANDLRGDGRGLRPDRAAEPA